MRTATEQAHAKINLTLDVLAKRPDGYHNVSMLMQTVELCDDVRVTLAEHGGVHACCDIPGLPKDGENLAGKAAAAFFAYIGGGQGADIEITKRIPSAAGLGGGSADAAAVLRALNALTGAALDAAALQSIGKTVGADVPFCVEGGSALAQGIGEILSSAPVLPDCFILLCKPPEGAQTSTIYRLLDEHGITHHPDTEAMLQALKNRDLADIGTQICNVMEPVTAAIFPEILKIKDEMRNDGAAGALMSGSGPTVYGLFARQEDALRAKEALAARIREVYLTRPWHAAE